MSDLDKMADQACAILQEAGLPADWESIRDKIEISFVHPGDEWGNPSFTWNINTRNLEARS